jgi:16S rRNA G966 N2-methylase RsmD
MNPSKVKVSKNDLKKICKGLGLKKYSLLKKHELKDLIENHTKVNENNEDNTQIILTLQTTATEETKIEIANNDVEFNKIYNEDCIIGMKKLKNETADIIICDPPYNIGKDFGNDSDKQQMCDY